jgi:hypothetical protein
LNCLTIKTKIKTRVMKKKILFIGAILGASFATIAQDEKVYTPEAEDWALSIDATPFLNYAGNFIGGNGFNTAPTWDFNNGNQTITGKYFASEDMAYRGSLRLGTSTWNDRAMVTDRTDTATMNSGAFPDMVGMVENTASYKSSFIGLSGGIEYRKGEGRLQGYYGGELGISVSSSKAEYTYGNALEVGAGDTTTFVGVSGADDFGMNITTDTWGNSARILSVNNGRTFTFGLRGFIGAEYFIFPKMALGAEFGWGMGISSTSGSTATMESIGMDGDETAFGTSTLVKGEQTIEGSKDNSFVIDTDNNNTMFGASGSLRLTLHF